MSAISATRRMVGKLSLSHSAMLLCDIQERFVPHIYNHETVLRTSQLLTSVSKELDIPLVVTEQYKKAFGPTDSRCFAEGFLEASGGGTTIPTTTTFEKKLFSMITPEVSDHIRQLNATSFVLFGIEAHVCVQQTALDLLELGHDVHIIVDATSSMKALDRQVALRRMEKAGAYLTTAQSAIFMLMQTADHPSFKAVSNLVKGHAKLPNEFNDSLLSL